MNPDKPNELFTKEEIEFNNKLVIEKRPMFMKHLYSKYKKDFKFHQDRYNYLCQKQYNLTIDDLLAKDYLNEEQKKLVDNYNKYNPLLDTDCPMNNISKYMEEQVKEIKINVKKKNHEKIFDILFNQNIDITEKEIKSMEKKYKSFLSSTRSLNATDNETDYESIDAYSDISKDIQKLANLAIYVNYKLYPNSNKNFAWNLFGNGIILNLHEKENGLITIPVENINGDINYRGSTYKSEEVIIEL